MGQRSRCLLNILYFFWYQRSAALNWGQLHSSVDPHTFEEAMADVA